MGGLVGLLAALLALLPGTPGFLPVGDGTPNDDVAPPLPDAPPARGSGRIEVALGAAADDADVAGGATGGFRSAVVTAVGEGDERHARVDADGLARIEGLAAGRYRVTVRAPGWVLAEQTLDVGAEGTARVRFALERSATLVVLVRSHEPHERRSPDDPPDGARVIALLPGRQLPRYTPSAPGYPLTLDTLPPETEIVVQARAADHEPEQRVVTTAAAGERSEITITLSPAALLAGVVVGPDGAPVGDARVVLAGSGVWPPRERMTDEAGRVAWPNVPAGI